MILACVFAFFCFRTGLPDIGGNYFTGHGRYYDDLVVTNLDVGKADCAVLQYRDTVGIIDTGTEEAGDTIEAFLKDNNIDSFDYMILTHYDKDHIGSAVRLLEDYGTDMIYIPDYVSKKKYYEGLMEELGEHENVVTVSAEPVTFTYDDLEMSIIPADDPAPLLEDEKNCDNNMSLVCMADFGSNRLLFTGDIEGDRISQMLETGTDMDADWIKIPHHGAYEKEVKDLLDAVTPVDSVISTSHEREPDEKLLKALEKRGINNYDTMTGNIVTICDGENMKITEVQP